MLYLPRNGELAQMLLTQPPCTKVMLSNELDCSEAVMEDKEGVRLGVIIERLHTIVNAKYDHKQPKELVQSSVCFCIEGFIAANSAWVAEAEKGQAEKDQAEKDQAEKDQAEKDQAEKDQADKDQAEKAKVEDSGVVSVTKSS